MAKHALLLAIGLLASASLAARADRIKNGNFEEPFVTTNDLTHWGEHGEVFGPVAQVKAGADGQPARAKAGNRMIVIDVPSNSWNGIWQQVKGGADQPFGWTASYMIVGGDLPDTVASFLKIEFYDVNGEFISGAEGEWVRSDTKGKWVETSMKAISPAGTKEVRFVIIAGENTEGAEVKNRIYWDDATAR